MLRWLLCPGRSPGLTESVSALRTSPRSPGAERDSFGVVASPKRMGRVATGDLMRHRCAPTNGVAMKYRVRVADIPSFSGREAESESSGVVAHLRSA